MLLGLGVLGALWPAGAQAQILPEGGWNFRRVQSMVIPETSPYPEQRGKLMYRIEYQTASGFRSMWIHENAYRDVLEASARTSQVMTGPVNRAIDSPKARLSQAGARVETMVREGVQTIQSRSSNAATRISASVRKGIATVAESPFRSAMKGLGTIALGATAFDVGWDLGTEIAGLIGITHAPAAPGATNCTPGNVTLSPVTKGELMTNSFSGIDATTGSGVTLRARAPRAGWEVLDTSNCTGVKGQQVTVHGSAGAQVPPPVIAAPMVAGAELVTMKDANAGGSDPRGLGAEHVLTSGNPATTPNRTDYRVYLLFVGIDPDAGVAGGGTMTRQPDVGAVGAAGDPTAARQPGGYLDQAVTTGSGQVDPDVAELAGLLVDVFQQGSANQGLPNADTNADGYPDDHNEDGQPDVGPDGNPLPEPTPQPTPDPNATPTATATTEASESAKQKQPGPDAIPPVDFDPIATAVDCDHFPFGIPCWVVDSIDAWVTEPIAPVFDLPPFPFTDEPVHVSLADFDQAMPIFRTAMLLLFTVALWMWAASRAKGEGGSDG